MRWCAALRTTDIIAQVTSKELVDEDDKDEEALMQQPSASQVMEALGVARLFHSFEEGEDDGLFHARTLEDSDDHCFQRKEAKSDRSFSPINIMGCKCFLAAQSQSWLFSVTSIKRNWV